MAEAQAELEKYQCLLNELPGIYEEKFRLKVLDAAEDVRHLLDERSALQEQVSRVLMQPRMPEALPPAAEVPLARSAAAGRSYACIAFSRPTPQPHHSGCPMGSS